MEVETEGGGLAIGAFLEVGPAVLANGEGNIRDVVGGMTAKGGMGPFSRMELTDGNFNGTDSFKGDRGIGCTSGGSGDWDASSNGEW